MDGFATAFAVGLQEKGYRGTFTLVMDDLDLTEFKGSLPDCLKAYTAAYLESKGANDSFRLYTHAYYKEDTDNIFCVFRVRFEEAFGFRAGHLRLQDARSGQSRGLRYHNNEQIPLAIALKKHFRRPGLWQRLRKRGH